MLKICAYSTLCADQDCMNDFSCSLGVHERNNILRQWCFVIHTHSLSDIQQSGCRAILG